MGRRGAYTHAPSPQPSPTGGEGAPVLVVVAVLVVLLVLLLARARGRHLQRHVLPRDLNQVHDLPDALGATGEVFSLGALFRRRNLAVEGNAAVDRVHVDVEGFDLRVRDQPGL